MYRVEVVQACDMPPCPRCDRAPFLIARVPVGNGVDLYLCRHCDTGPTAGGRLLAIIDLPADLRPPDLVHDFMTSWAREGLTAQGWRPVTRPDPSD